MLKLPEDFITEIKDVLGADAERYFAFTDSEPYKGISVNRLKTDPERLLPLLGFETMKSPFYADGYYISGETEGIGKTPLHHAGAFYVQEPSASSAVTLLDISVGEKILDLCAAPGGKSAQIASCLCGTGLIWSNEIVRNRAQILLSNFERMGIPNGVVSSCYPDTLCRRLGGFFDKVLVDAPCSGEGMFRKNPAAVDEWSREHVLSCSERQLSILCSAAEALRPGGILVYSTCTFSHEENEGVITSFLETHPDFEPCDISAHFGRQTSLPCAVRITPIEGGEGHFAAKLRKKCDAAGDTFSAVIRNDVPAKTGREKRSPKAAGRSADISPVREALSDIFLTMPQGELVLLGDKAYIMPAGLPELSGLGVIRAGVFAGELKKNRFEPAHALFTAYAPQSFRRVLELELSDPRTDAFLRGMEIGCGLPSGYAAVSVEGMTVGFGKCSSDSLKNKYPKGLRNV